MACADDAFRSGMPTSAYHRLSTVIQLFKSIFSRKNAGNAGGIRASTLEPHVMRDVGARRDYLDYGPSVDFSNSSDRRLHHIADAIRDASFR